MRTRRRWLSPGGGELFSSALWHSYLTDAANSDRCANRDGSICTCRTWEMTCDQPCNEVVPTVGNSETAGGLLGLGLAHEIQFAAIVQFPDDTVWGKEGVGAEQ